MWPICCGWGVFSRNTAFCTPPDTADSKLDTPENPIAAIATGGQFLCGAAFTQPLQEQFRQLRGQLRPLDYCPKSHAERPPEERDHYLGCETTAEVTAAFGGRTLRHKYRLLFFHSSAKAKQQAATRGRHLDKIREEFELVERNLGKYSGSLANGPEFLRIQFGYDQPVIQSVTKHYRRDSRWWLPLWHALCNSHF